MIISKEQWDKLFSSISFLGCVLVCSLGFYIAELMKSNLPIDSFLPLGIAFLFFIVGPWLVDSFVMRKKASICKSEEWNGANHAESIEQFLNEHNNSSVKHLARVFCSLTLLHIPSCVSVIVMSLTLMIKARLDLKTSLIFIYILTLIYGIFVFILLYFIPSVGGIFDFWISMAIIAYLIFVSK